MEHLTVREALSGWDIKDLTNLWVMLGGKDEDPTIDGIEDKIKWLYHSRTRAGVEALFKRTSSDELRDVPRYDRLVRDAAKHLQVYSENTSLEESQLFIAHAVIIASLQCMSPRNRADFFSKTFSVDEMTRAGGIKSTSLQGPMTVLSALGAAQASGFGIYMASTTALGFLTHAVGVTLPFAAYTGLTHSIAFVIGPAGWLMAGFWTFWKLTQPKWKTLIGALVYIFATNARRKLEAEQASLPTPAEQPKSTMLTLLLAVISGVVLIFIIWIIVITRPATQ